MACSASRAGTIEKMTTMKKWNGTVDGQYCHKATMILLETYESWAGVWWNARLGQAGLPM